MLYAAQNNLVPSVIDVIDDAFLYNIELSLHEICSNIIEHAYKNTRGEISIQFTIDAQLPQLQIDLYDSGETFDQNRVTPPNLDEPQVKGYGLFLAHHLLDTVTYKRQGEFNHWCLISSW